MPTWLLALPSRQIASLTLVTLLFVTKSTRVRSGTGWGPRALHFTLNILHPPRAVAARFSASGSVLHKPSPPPGVSFPFASSLRSLPRRPLLCHFCELFLFLFLLPLWLCPLPQFPYSSFLSFRWPSAQAHAFRNHLRVAHVSCWGLA